MILNHTNNYYQIISVKSVKSVCEKEAELKGSYWLLAVSRWLLLHIGRAHTSQ
jgi:hypothetical protein